MNNARPKPVAEINLEEFERRLRASAAPQAGVEDPLAELTRLVDAIGFERTPSERALEADRGSRLAAKPEKPAAKPELRLAAPQESPAPPAPPSPPRLEIEPPAPSPTPKPPAAPPPLIDAEPALRPSFDAEDLDSSAFEPPAPSMETRPAVEAPSVGARREAARSRSWGLKVGGLIAAAAVMAGAVVVFKVGGHSRSGAPVLVLAPTTPTKVAPPNEVTIRTANESGSLLTRDTAQPTPTPPKLVDPPEAPVDLSARPEASPSVAASAAPSPAASAASPSPAASAAAPSPTASASAVADASPIAPSADTAILAPPAPAATPMSPVGADPSRVKTISVRPDGTLISSGYEAAATQQAAAPAPSPQKQADADTEASTPAVALPTKLSPPKTSARVVSKTDTTAPADAGDGPAPVAPKAKKPKPAVEAEAKSDDAEAAAPSGGGYAVQFAAPKSESEAKALVKRFQGRYADALGGAQFAVRKAERHGETIYRVRAVGLTKSDAKAMCAKIKGDGGDCYYAKD